MSHGDYGEHFYCEWFTMAVAWTHQPQVVHVGVNAMCGHWEAVTPAKFEGDNLAVLAAARFHEGVGQWWVDQVISQVSMGCWPSTSATTGSCRWRRRR